MALSRRTKKLLKGYAGYKGAKVFGRYGLWAAAGMGLYRWMKNRRATQNGGMVYPSTDAQAVGPHV